jgi:hypothetical protein
VASRCGHGVWTIACHYDAFLNGPEEVRAPVQTETRTAHH